MVDSESRFKKRRDTVTKIVKFDKQNLAFIRRDLDAALAKVGESYGIKLSIGNIKFSGETFRTQLEAAVVADGNAMTKEAKAFTIFAHLDGMDKSWLFKEFTAGGAKHRIVGYRSRASKKPVMTKTPDGLNYVWPAESVVAYMKSQGN